MPVSRRKYWLAKIDRNKKRDRQVKRRYAKEEWNVLRFWEHDIKNAKKLRKKIKDRINKVKR